MKEVYSRIIIILLLVSILFCEGCIYRLLVNRDKELFEVDFFESQNEELVQQQDEAEKEIRLKGA